MKKICYECNKSFKTKRELVEHLREELEDANEVVSGIESQLYDLGIENPYEEK